MESRDKYKTDQVQTYKLLLGCMSTSATYHVPSADDVLQLLYPQTMYHLIAFTAGYNRDIHVYIDTCPHPASLAVHVQRHI